MEPITQNRICFSLEREILIFIFFVFKVIWEGRSAKNKFYILILITKVSLLEPLCKKACLLNQTNWI